MNQKAYHQIRGGLRLTGRKQLWLAVQVGVTESTMSLWLGGSQLPSRENRERLAQITELPVSSDECWL